MERCCNFFLTMIHAQKIHDNDTEEHDQQKCQLCMLKLTYRNSNAGHGTSEILYFVGS